jgi:hypothetical protein
VPEASSSLASQIAVLDAEFEAKGEEPSAERRSEYERRRAQLKQLLNEALAREGGGK